MSALSKLAELSGEERRLLVTAAGLLPLVGLSLRLFGYQKTQRALARSIAQRRVRPPSPADRFARGRRVARCVRIAARRGPYRTTCLRESLVTWWLLERRGIPANIVIGVGKDEGELRSHAWVEVDGTPVLDESDIGQVYASIHRAGRDDRAAKRSAAREPDEEPPPR